MQDEGNATVVLYEMISKGLDERDWLIARALLQVQSFRLTWRYGRTGNWGALN